MSLKVQKALQMPRQHFTFVISEIEEVGGGEAAEHILDIKNDLVTLE